MHKEGIRIYGCLPIYAKINMVIQKQIHIVYVQTYSNWKYRIKLVMYLFYAGRRALQTIIYHNLCFRKYLLLIFLCIPNANKLSNNCKTTELC